MRTLIVAAFPGTGKSWFHNNLNLSTCDSDSSQFSWTYVDGQKIRNPDFPSNYMDHIRSLMGTVDYIFCSTHKEVRLALSRTELGPSTLLAYPHAESKEIYMKRYADRGSPKPFLDLMFNNWDVWINELEAESPLLWYKLQLIGSEYLSDRLDDLNYISVVN